MDTERPLEHAAVADVAAYRRRTEVLGAFFAAVSAVSGILILQSYGTFGRIEATAMLVVSALCVVAMGVALLPLSHRARARLSDVLSALIVAAYALPLLFSAWGPPMQDPAQSAFRPIFGFTGLVYIGLIVLKPTRAGLRRLWAFYAAQLVVVLAAVAVHTGFDPAREGMVALLLWLVFGNLFFILMLASLEYYARALRVVGAEAVAADALRSSETYLQLVLHSIQAGAWGWRVEGSEKRWVSPRFCELLEWEPDDPDAPDSVVALLHPDDRVDFETTLDRQLGHGALFDATARLRVRSGDHRWFNVRGHVVRAEDGAIREAVGAIVDIDDQVQSRQALADSNARLEYLAYHDALTGLRNRRYFLDQFEHEIGRTRRHREALSLLIVDIDHFKPYNDHYGHSAGDEALVAVAGFLSGCARRSVDVAARFGGEEFALLLQSTDAAGALRVARRIRATVEAAAVPHQRAPQGVLTVSVGATTCEPAQAEVAEIDLMIEEADAALYRVKSQGRNGAWHYVDAVNDADAEGDASPSAQR